MWQLPYAFLLLIQWYAALLRVTLPFIFYNFEGLIGWILVWWEFTCKDKEHERKCCNMTSSVTACWYFYFILESSFDSAYFILQDPERIILHIIIDALNYPAINMWFLTNPPTPAAIQIKSLDDLKWLPGDFSSRFKLKAVRDPRYTSALNHLRFNARSVSLFEQGSTPGP
jgi:hypothetical protein